MDLSPPIRQRFFDANGDPLAGGKLFSYIAGTTTPKATYVDRAGTPNTNPIVLDADGYCDVWIGPGYTKFVLKDSNDVTIWTKDLVGLPSGGATSVPSGGLAGQVLAKSTNNDYEMNWVSLQYINETSFTIANNQSSPADVTGLVFDKTVVGSAIITYWIKRRTTSTGAKNLVEGGMMLATYDIDTETWSLVPLGAGPNYAEVDFTINSSGQVRYVSSNLTGTPHTSKMKFKATSMGI